jgi:hypothetical protein
LSVKNRLLFDPTEIAALILGCAFLLVGIIVKINTLPAVPQTDVKQQNIPVSLDDFKDDPSVYNAIQTQLGGKEQAAPTPQSQPGSPQTVGGSLQSTAAGLQAQ